MIRYLCFDRPLLLQAGKVLLRRLVEAVACLPLVFDTLHVWAFRLIAILHRNIHQIREAARRAVGRRLHVTAEPRLTRVCQLLGTEVPARHARKGEVLKVVLNLGRGEVWVRHHSCVSSG